MSVRVSPFRRDVLRTIEVKYYFIIFSFLLSTFSFSQNEVYEKVTFYKGKSQLQNFNTKDGLPQSQVNDIVQDSIGYLWLATEGGGIARFDGREFTVYNQKGGLQSNFVSSLLVTNDTLLIGTNSGLSIFTKGKFTNFESPKINKVVAVDGSIYLATVDGIYRYEDNSVIPINAIYDINTGNIRDIIRQELSYLVATDKGLWRLGKLETPSFKEKIDSTSYTSLQNIKGQIVGTTQNSGIYIVGGKRLYTYNKQINRIYYVDQQFWVSTESDGIMVLDQDFRTIEKINQGNGLAINQIKAVLKDKQENIWVATSGGGLYKLTQNNFQHFDRNNGLRGNRIYAVHNEGDEIWVSTSNLGITRIDKLGISPIFDDNGYLDVNVRTIASDKNDHIWAGTDGKGILIFKRKYLELDSLDQSSKFKKSREEVFPGYVLETDTLTTENGLASNSIRKILIDNDKAWIATQSDGIVEYSYAYKDVIDKMRKAYGSKVKLGDYDMKIANATNKVAMKHYGLKDGIRDLKINDLEKDSDGKIWYSTLSGNLGYIINSTARGFYQVLGKPISITTIEIKEDNLYLGTLGDGIWIVNKKSPREIKKLSGVKELNSENIYQIIFDNENNLWAGTDKGVNKIVLDENNSISDVFYFDRSNGFLGIETCQNAVAKDPPGNIWFGTMNGLTQYTPTKSQAKKIKPTVYFENIEVAYQPIDSVNINTYAQVLTLSPTQNHLSFQFKSIDINHPKGIEYRWKLNGNFSPWSTKDYIDFPNLRYGNYELVVEARNVDWIVSDPIRFKFFINTPFFERRVVKIVGIASAGLILLVIAFITAQRIRKRNRRKVAQLKMENHLLSLEQRALQLQMNPHFIFNVLNGIKAMGYEGDTQQMNTTINTFATLLRSILNSSRAEEISLQEEIKTLTNYLSLEQQMASKPFEFHIQYTTAGIDPEEILIPPMLIQPFVENSVKHGFQHNAIDGKIEVNFNVKGEYLECEIKDNGIGIEQSKLKKKSHHPSTALKVTQERIESLTKNHDLQIREDNGTIVSFRLPLKTDF